MLDPPLLTKMTIDSMKSIPLFQSVMLELTSHCNRDCFFCNRSTDDSGKRKGKDGEPVIQSMPTEHVIRILDEMSSLGFKGMIAFHHMSEPFLDSRLIDFAKEAKKRGMSPHAFTNGDVLRRKDDICQEAVKVFDGMRIGLYDAQSESDVAKEEQFWYKRLQGTKVSFSKLDNLYRRTYISSDSPLIPEKNIFQNAACDRPSQRLIVHYDGNMALCCEDMKDTFDLGNAFETSIEELWFSKKHISIIKDLRKGLRNKYPLCSKCPLPHLAQPSPLRRLRIYLGRIKNKILNR